MTPIFTGTAAELAELTRKWWAAEWWPSGLVYETDFEPVWVAEEGTVSPKDASSIIFASAWLPLSMEGWEPQLFPPVDWRPSFVVKLGNDLVRRGEGPSPLHAVLAALEVVGMSR